MFKKILFFSFLILILNVRIIFCDVVHLRDGKMREGKILYSTSGNEKIILKNNSGTHEIEMNEINKIDISNYEFREIKKEEKNIPEDVIKLLNEINQLKINEEAGAIYFLDSSVATLNPDGSSKTETHIIVKILKDRKKRMAFCSFGYDKQRESVDIEIARTIKPDGTVKNVLPSMITDSERFQGSQFYSRYKTKSFTMPDVTVGDIIEYKVIEYTHKPLFKNYFSPRFYFTSSEPVIHSKFKVNIPIDEELNFVYRNRDNYDLKPVITTNKEKSQKSYYWERDNIPALVEESVRPPYSEIVSCVETSMFKNWDPIFDWNGEKLKKHIEESSDEIKKTVEELTKDCRTEDEKIAEVYYWMQKNIRYISIKGDVVSGLAGHPASETFKKKYGDCVDKAVLMSAMLRHIGIECHPTGVMTNNGGNWETDIPAYFVNHSFVYIVKKDGSELFLDPTTTNYRYPYYRSDDFGVKALIATKRMFKETDIPLVYVRDYKKETEILESGGLVISSHLEAAGSLEAAYRGFLKNLKPQERQDALTKFLNSAFPGTTIISPFKFGDVDDLSKQFFLDSEYKIDNYVVKASDLMVFQMPGIEKSYSELALKKRKYDLEYHKYSAYKGENNVKIPKNYTIEFLPEPVNIVSKYIKYSGKYEKTENGFRFIEDYRRISHRIPVKEYDAFKKIARKLQDFSMKKIILKREGGENE